MGERRNESELDELDMLLGEIPNVTSGSPLSEGLISNPSKGFKSESLHNNLSHSSPSSIHVNSSHNIVGIPKVPVNKILKSRIKSPNMPDELSLTPSFSELSFSDELNHPTGTMYGLLPNHGLMLDEYFLTSLVKRPSLMDSQGSIAPSLRPPHNPSCYFQQECSNLNKIDGLELKKAQAFYSQPNENNFFAHGVHGFQFSSNVPVPHLGYPLIADQSQQQYFVNSHSQFEYLHSQILGQTNIAWGQGEEERHYTMHRQFLFWQQQLQNQIVESQVPIQKNDNVPSRLMGRRMTPPYKRVPVSTLHEDYIRKSCGNCHAVSKGLIESNTLLSEKADTQMFPEKILTRSHGLNSMRATKFGSTGKNEQSPNHFSQTKRNLVKENYFQSSCPLQLDCTVFQGFSPESMDGKDTSPRLQPLDNTFLEEVCGKIYLMAKDQNGCRFLQKKFMEGSREVIEKIYLEIIGHVVELMTDPFGNYLVQKLLEVCNENQLMQILRAITRNFGELIRISCDIHGTRAVQKVIETLKSPLQSSLVVSSLKPGIVTLIKNMNGSHVAQRCLQYLMPEYREFIFEAAIANCVELATDRHGCCVVQKCLGHSDGDQRCRLISEITSNSLILSQDPFGNYVIQFVFELEIPWATMDIVGELRGNYGDLSMQKCSSNVVEKCLKYAREESCSGIIQELISNPRLDQIMQDPYGNYVIQAALNQSKGALHAALVDAIRPHIPVLRTSPYGKKVLSSYGPKK